MTLFKVGEVFVVSKDINQMGGASEVLVPFRECMYDSKEFAVIDIIVSFSRSEGL